MMGLAACGDRRWPTKCIVIRRTADGGSALVPDYFEYHTTARRSYWQRFVELSVPRAAATIRSISTPRTGSASPTARPACSACSRTRWWT